MKIDDDIPMPDATPRRSQFQDVVDQLKIGQSFFIATDRVDSVRVLVLKCGHRAGIVCATRQWEQEGETGIRVWRVE